LEKSGEVGVEFSDLKTGVGFLGELELFFQEQKERH
jgi:hypothetical protein